MNVGAAIVIGYLALVAVWCVIEVAATYLPRHREAVAHFNAHTNTTTKEN